MSDSIYNEAYYLQNPEIIRFFHDVHQKHVVRWNTEKKVFHDTLLFYDEFVSEVAQLLQKLGYHSCLDCSIILSYLITHGYLSKDKFFENGSYQFSTEISSKLGTSIIKGRGCCRNYAGIQQDVFHKLNLPVEPFYCYEGFNLFQREADFPANHVVNLVVYNQNLYGIDLYNSNRLYSFHTPFFLKENATKTRFILRYKPYYEIIMGASVKDVYDNVHRFQDFSKKEVLSPVTYENDILIKTKRKMEQSNDCLQDFHNKTKSLKNRIAHQLYCRLYEK